MSKNELKLHPQASDCMNVLLDGDSHTTAQKWCIFSFPRAQCLKAQMNAYRKRLQLNDQPVQRPIVRATRNLTPKPKRTRTVSQTAITRRMSGANTSLPSVLSSLCRHQAQMKRAGRIIRMARQRSDTKDKSHETCSTRETANDNGGTGSSPKTTCTVGDKTDSKMTSRKPPLPWQQPTQLAPFPCLRALLAMPSAIRVAIVDDNKNALERTRHPGPYNIKACLAAQCHRPSMRGLCTGKSFFGTQFLSTRKIRQGALEQQPFDVLIFPGGSCKKQMKLLGQRGARQIEAFVSRGGGLVGICAGAYTFSSRGLSLVPVRSGKPFHRGHGYTAVRFTPKGRRLLWDEGLDWREEPEEVKPNTVSIRYHNGPAMLPLPVFQQRITRSNSFVPLAYYETEIENGCVGLSEPIEDRLSDSAAITYSQYGEGSIIAIGPHPESTHHGNQLSKLPGKPRMQRILQRAVLVASGRWRGEACE